MRIYLSLLLIGCSFWAAAQSYSGNLKSKDSEAALGYGNVDIYQEDVLVASVLADELGNFKVALDTGKYTAVINYFGHLPVREEIYITSDETSEIALEADPSMPKPVLITHEKIGRAETMSMEESVRESSDFSVSSRRKIRGFMSSDSRSDGYRHSESPSGMGAMELPLADMGGGGSPRSGSLTAGEVNDFAKWELWQDLTNDQMKGFAKSWGLAPTGRYTLQLTNQVGLPLADAKVDLASKGGEVLYSARTDNTGKAELWLSITDGEITRSELIMTIDYRGQTSRIRRVKPFNETINHHSMEVDCNEMNNVDIAFVVDATGSMGDELSYLQAEMNDVMFKAKQISSKLNFHFANVFYRDKGDEYVTRTMDFSRVLSESVQFINEQYAGGGGDYEEAVEDALEQAVNNLSWNEEARTRIIFLILDAPPHNTDINRTKLARLAKEAAAKGIKIVPVGASGINKSTEYLLRSLAIGTNGTYTFLTDHSGIGNGHIEPSTDSYKVETFNDLMVRIIKSYTYMPDCEQNLPELNLDYPDSVVTMVNHIDSLPADSLYIADSTNVRDSLDNQNNQVPQVSWSYYPNPTTGIINIRADVDIDELFITDLSGKLLQSVKRITKGRVQQVDLSQYTTGIYLIRYLHEDRWISGKVMLQR